MSVAIAHYAFDKQSARSFDADGRMRVRGCTISVAEVNPYYGKEIPGHTQLGLDANTVYDLYRDPEDLAAAVDSFNGLPLMIRHVAQTAKEPRKMDQAGSVYNTRFQDGKLLADLLITDAQAIELIESEALADLSSSYRYTPDMTAGEIDGRKFHGRMRAIQGNHVALVEDGRATGAHVADSALSSTTGAKTVDENTPDVAQALLLLTQKLEGIEGRLAKLEGGESVISVDPPAVIADDEDPDKKDDKANDEDPDKKDDKDPPAMDAKTVQGLIDAAVSAERENAKRLEAAKRACREDLGEMIAMDNAGDIYRAALKQRGVDVSTIPAGAEQAAYTAIKSALRGTSGLANDSRTPSADAKRVTFDTSHIRNR